MTISEQNKLRATNFKVVPLNSTKGTLPVQQAMGLFEAYWPLLIKLNSYTSTTKSH